MLYLFVFLLGMLVGGGIFVGYGWYQVNKMTKLKNNLLDQIKTKAEEMDKKKESIKERLVKASELAQAQMSIRAQMEMPSKNALHSRYKNGLIGELQDMEQQKLNLLKTILDDGFDPLITVINDTGAKTEMPLSAYVNEASLTLGESLGTSETTPPIPTDPTQPKKAGKFIVYKGGKDDGTTH